MIHIYVWQSFFNMWLKLIGSSSPVWEGTVHESETSKMSRWIRFCYVFNFNGKIPMPDNKNTQNIFEI